MYLNISKNDFADIRDKGLFQKSVKMAAKKKVSIQPVPTIDQIVKTIFWHAASIKTVPGKI